MATRRRRKRRDRQAQAQAVAQHDARNGIWSSASRGDLRLLRHAVRAGWPVPKARRPAILEEVCALLDSNDPRLAIAVVWVFLEADKTNPPGSR